MAIVLNRLVDTGFTLLVNPAVGTWDGNTLTMGATGADWLFSVRSLILPATQILEGAVNLGTTAGSPNGTYRAEVSFRDVNGAAVGPTVAGAYRTIGSGAGATLTTPPITAPDNAYTIDLAVFCQAGPAGRKIVRNAVGLNIGAQPDEVLAATLERDQRRTAEVGGGGALVVTQAPPGPRAGQITYLCHSWAQVAALDALYRSGIVTSQPVPPVLPGLIHYATGTVRMATERAVNGQPSRWLVTVPIREVS